MEKKTNKSDSSRTFYVVDKVNLDLRNVRFCSRGDSCQKGKQQNIAAEKNLAVTVDPVVTACRVPFLSLVFCFSIIPGKFVIVISFASYFRLHNVFISLICCFCCLV